MNAKKKNLTEALKEAGYNCKHVSIKEQRGGFDWSFTVTIRSSEVNLEAVKQAAKKITSIDRCEASGEILGGGNTYVFIRASEAVAEAWGVSPYRIL